LFSEPTGACAGLVQRKKMSNSDPHYIPSRLDSQEKFLWWDKDVLFIAMGCICAGVAFNVGLIGGIVGIALGMGYSRLKTGKHPGMANHLLYWHVGAFRMKGLPKSSDRFLIG
jgi:conjugal transfer pilus assembly protein TraL